MNGRLLIVSHTPHYRREGHVVGWGATIREIDEMAALFDSVVHIAPMYPEAAPGSAIAYQSPRVRLHPVMPAGGDRLREKLGILLRLPGYAAAILRERKNADVIHVRAPANISLLALVLLGMLPGRKVDWAKYAGDWNPSDSEPGSYRFQRWWLRRGMSGGLVTVNGRWPEQPAHIHSFLNPCLTEGELQEGAAAGREKKLSQPVRLVFVGRLESSKGVGVCLEIMVQLQAAGVAAQLDLIGDGAEQARFEQRVRELNVAERVRFHGGLPRTALGEFYGRAHFLLLPTNCSEGWPKVLSEAMAYGAVPVTTAISSIPQYLENFATGRAIPVREAARFTGAILDYLKSPAQWETQSRNAVAAARQFSYENYLRAVRALLKLPDAALPGVG